MRDILSELSAIDAVVGSVVFNGHGAILQDQVPEIYKSQLSEAIRGILRSIAPKQAEEPAWELKSLFARYDGGYLVVRHIKDLFLAVICESRVKLSYLQIAINVAATKLGRWEPGASASSISIRPGISSATPSAASLPPRPAASGETAGVQHQVPPDAVSERTVELVTRVLAEFVGPIAKIAVQRALRQLNATPQTLGASLASPFLFILEREIDLPAERPAFLAKATKILPIR